MNNNSNFAIDIKQQQFLDINELNIWNLEVITEDSPLDASCNTTLSAIEGMELDLDDFDVDEALQQIERDLSRVHSDDALLLDSLPALLLDFDSKNYCEMCDVQLSNSSNFKRHLQTSKHLQMQQQEMKPTLDQLTGLDLADEFDFEEEEEAMVRRKTRKSRVLQQCRSGGGKKLFRCSHCPKVFTTGSNLNRHENLHNRRKLHECKTCGKRFQQKEYLKKHGIVHERSKKQN